MNHDNRVDDMYITFDDGFVCESCNLSKIIKQPYTTITQDQSTIA